MDRMVKRLQKELEFMQKNPDVFRVMLPTNDLRVWHIDFRGAKGTIYEG
jgi:ubiquitin-protein ligase